MNDDDLDLVRDLMNFSELLGDAERLRAQTFSVTGLGAPPVGDRAVMELATKKDQINSARPVVEAIAERLGEVFEEDLATWLDEPDFASARAVVVRMIGTLTQQEKIDRIRGPRGPKLAAANMHSWVWEEAAPRWEHGFFRDAVQTAATRIFDTELPAKLQTQPVDSPADLFSAFKTDPNRTPHPEKRLRFLDVPPDDPSWESLHRGALLYGQGCVKAIRNPRTHRLGAEEQVALEELAALSLLARWIDEATLVEEPPIREGT